MQQSPLTLRQRLIEAVDERYHVKDMAAIVEVLGTLERLSVTKELLETTRLGKTVNEFRKRINNAKLAKRAKALVKKWRDAVLQPTALQQPPQPLNGNSLLPVPVSEGPGLSLSQGSVHPQALSVQRLGISISTGYSSTSSSPKFSSSSKVSPSGSQNSNSLSPRILTNLVSNSNSNSNLSRNGGSADSFHRDRIISATVSSPVLNSASLRVSPSYGNKTKTTFGPTVSPLLQVNNKTPASVGVAPNSEVVARTNAANKRLRIEDDAELGPVVGQPPSKKVRTLVNGAGIEGTLDDPMILDDELSKDSTTSRVSDNSDGSSSKPVSNVSSGAILSGAPSPLTATQDSNLSPPLSIGIGADTSEALISQEDSSSFITTETEISAVTVNPGADVMPAAISKPQPVKRGRRKKNKDYLDSEELLEKQIARAQQESKKRTIERLSRETLDEERSRSPPDLTQEKFRRAVHTAAALSPEDSVIKNEIVEKYLQSQNELRAQMERQYQDAVKRNEFHEEIAVGPSPEVSEEGKKLKKKKKNKKENSVDTAAPHLPSESEILSRLPPIDPQILADFQDYEFYYDPKPDEDEKVPKSDNNETENSDSLSLNQQSNIQPTNATSLIGAKIDWGDSDEEDDFVEVPLKPVVSVSVADVDEVDNNTRTKCVTSSLPDVSMDSTLTPHSHLLEDEDKDNPPKEVDESEVERLHTEKLENLNGNRDKDGIFREWHETLTVESFNSDLLHILPYTIIDF